MVAQSVVIPYGGKRFLLPILINVISGKLRIALSGFHILLYKPNIRIVLQGSGRVAFRSRNLCPFLTGKHRSAIRVQQPSFYRQFRPVQYKTIIQTSRSFIITNSHQIFNSCYRGCHITGRGDVSIINDYPLYIRSIYRE